MNTAILGVAVSIYVRVGVCSVARLLASWPSLKSIFRSPKDVSKPPKREYPATVVRVAVAWWRHWLRVRRARDQEVAGSTPGLGAAARRLGASCLHHGAPVTRHCNLVPINGRRRCATGKVTVGPALQRLCVTDTASRKIFLDAVYGYGLQWFIHLHGPGAYPRGYKGKPRGIKGFIPPKLPCIQLQRDNFVTDMIQQAKIIP